MLDIYIVKDQGQIFGAIKGSSMKILLGQDLDISRGWKYRRLCSVPPLNNTIATQKGLWVSIIIIMTLHVVCEEM